MIYPDVNIENWTKKLGLQPYIVNCKSCGTPNKPDKAFVTHDSAGLYTEQCKSCLSSLRLYSSVPRTEEAARDWDDTMCEM